MMQIRSKIYGESSVNRREILRYAGMKEETPETEAILDECLSESYGKFSAKVCWGIFDLLIEDDRLDFGFSKVVSRNLSATLSGCGSVILFAATVGLEIDRLLARYRTLSPVKALFFQAIGAERIEDLCDRFEKDMRAELVREGGVLIPRFSPGYGDFPLTFQKEIFRALDVPRKIGLTLNESLLMSPTKSVTAVIGIRREN